MKPRLAITMGDVNGIGPEIMAKALARKELWTDCEPVIIGSAAYLEQMSQEIPGCPKPCVTQTCDAPVPEGSVRVLEAGMPAPEPHPGTVDAEAGRCAVEWLKYAIRLTQEGQTAAIVTCPLNKHGIHLAGYSYNGHTEILAEMTQTEEVYMSLFTDRMRIVHVSAHCPIREVPERIKKERIIRTIRAAHESLCRLGLSRKRIAVAGLNPHAGEEGILGREEQQEIGPAVKACREAGMDCVGPFPPDTVFLRMFQGEFDLVVAMYHDQGHIPLKLVAMDDGVNVTLGLPIVRTSVDHGTAYDIAGKGCAREKSLCAAIKLAIRLAGQ